MRERLALLSPGTPSGPGAPSGSGIGSARYLARWVVFGVAIGIVAGLGAIAFFWLLTHGVDLFLGRLVGYLPPTPLGEGGRANSSMTRRWALPLVVALGGLLSGLIVFFTAPEATGDGVDAALTAFHHRGGEIRARIPLIKMIASAITLGSGGSGGREGPTAQISAGFGSVLGQLLDLEPRERRILVATGIGAGIGAIFRAPLGGALLAAEIPYKHDMEVEALLPSLIASIVGYSIFGAWAGWQPMFGALPGLGYTKPHELIYYAILGILCGLVGILYVKCYEATSEFFQTKLELPAWLRPALGGLIVGLIGLAIPQVLGTGYGWAQLSLSSSITTALPLWIILLLPFAKIVATSLTVGSGGSAGLFGPGVVIGGMLGAAFWTVGHGVLPGMPATPAPFSIIAMMALFGGIVHAPLAIMLMVAEMTGNLSLLAPAMITVFLATFVAGEHTIYPAQLPTRADSPAHRYQFSFPLLSSLAVRDAMARAFVAFRPEMTVAEAEAGLADDSLSGAPVVVEHQRLVGVATVADIARVAPERRGELAVAAIMTRSPATIDPDAGLDIALEALSTRGVSWMPVVRPRDQRVVGVLSAAGVISAYRGALRRTVRKMRGLTDDTVLLESRVEAGSPLAGTCLREMRLPAETLVVSIQRGGTTVMPHGDTRIEAGDRLMLLTGADHEQQVRDFLEPSREEQRAAAEHAEQDSLTNGAP